MKAFICDRCGEICRLGYNEKPHLLYMESPVNSATFMSTQELCKACSEKVIAFVKGTHKKPDQQ